MLCKNMDTHTRFIPGLPQPRPIAPTAKNKAWLYPNRFATEPGPDSQDHIGYMYGPMRHPKKVDAYKVSVDRIRPAHSGSGNAT